MSTTCVNRRACKRCTNTCHYASYSRAVTFVQALHLFIISFALQGWKHTSLPAIPKAKSDFHWVCFCWWRTMGVVIDVCILLWEVENTEVMYSYMYCCDWRHQVRQTWCERNTISLVGVSMYNHYLGTWVQLCKSGECIYVHPLVGDLGPAL